MPADPTTEFFEQLSERGREPLLTMASGVVRFDIVDNGHSERWVVAIDSGSIDVSRRSVTGDINLRVPRKLFDQIVQGKANTTAAVLRGDIETEGDDWRLLVLLQRLFRRKEDGQP